MRSCRREPGRIVAPGTRSRRQPRCPLDPFGRRAGAAILVLAASFQLAAFLIEVQHSKTIDRLEWIAAHAVRANVAKTFDVLAMPFLFGVVVVYVLLTRERSRRLAYTGGILVGCGMVGLAAAQGFEVLEFALAEDGRFPLTDLADAVDNVSSAPAVAMLLLFIPGAFLGLLTLTVALWRSQAVPRAAVALIPLFILTDFFLHRVSSGTRSRWQEPCGSRPRCCSPGASPAQTEAMAERTPIPYAGSGDVEIAYQVTGERPLDVVFAPARSPTSISPGIGRAARWPACGLFELKGIPDRRQLFSVVG